MAENEKFDLKAYQREYSKKRKEKDPPLTVRVPKELYDEFCNTVMERGETRTSVLIDFITRYVKANKDGRPLW